jgi:hypothetical protein
LFVTTEKKIEIVLGHKPLATGRDCMKPNTLLLADQRATSEAAAATSGGVKSQSKAEEVPD